MMVNIAQMSPEQDQTLNSFIKQLTPHAQYSASSDGNVREVATYSGRNRENPLRVIVPGQSSQEVSSLAQSPIELPLQETPKLETIEEFQTSSSPKTYCLDEPLSVQVVSSRSHLRESFGVPLQSLIRQGSSSQTRRLRDQRSHERSPLSSNTPIPDYGSSGMALFG